MTDKRLEQWREFVNMVGQTRVNKATILEWPSCTNPERMTVQIAAPDRDSCQTAIFSVGDRPNVSRAVFSHPGKSADGTGWVAYGGYWK